MLRMSSFPNILNVLVATCNTYRMYCLRGSVAISISLLNACYRYLVVQTIQPQLYQFQSASPLLEQSHRSIREVGRTQTQYKSFPRVRSTAMMPFALQLWRTRGRAPTWLPAIYRRHPASCAPPLSHPVPLGLRAHAISATAGPRGV